MILDEKPKEMASLKGTDIETADFKIKSSQKAFSILSSNLYSNNFLAIVRELACNAYDSHIQAGKKDVPFEIHLPTTIDNKFYVRDFGVGLDHDEVMQIYTTYFESTKTGSNDYVGALGLGSKTPFSYTSNFTVEAIKDGVKRIYSSYINNSGFPSIALLNTNKTDECNGVTVAFAAKNKNDVYRFADECKKALVHFDPEPEMTGYEVDIPKFEFEAHQHLENVGVRALKVTRFNKKEDVVVMGNVSYKMDSREIAAKYEHSFSTKNNLQLYFGIGELDIQPSREGLQYTERTKNKILERYEQVKDAISKDIDEKIGDVKDIWVLRQKLAEHENSVWKHQLGRGILNDKLKKISENVDGIKSYSKYNDVLFENLHSNLSRRFAETEFNIKVNRIDYYINNDQTVKYKNNNSYKDVIPLWATSPGRDIVFVLNADKKRVISKMKSWLEEYKVVNKKPFCCSCIVLSPVVKSKPMDVDGFFGEIYNPPSDMIYQISDFDLEKHKRTENRVKRREILSTSRNSFFDVIVDRNSPDFTVEYLDQTHSYPILYTYLEGNSLKDSTGNPFVVGLEKAYNEMTKSDIGGFSHAPLYAVRSGKSLDVIKNHPKFVLLEDMVCNSLRKIKVENLLFVKKNFKRYDENISINSIEDYKYIEDLKNHPLYKRIPIDSPYRKLYDRLNMDMKYVRDGSISRLIRFVENIMPKSEFDKLVSIQKEASDIISSAKTRYPLLSGLNNVSKIDVGDLLEYVEMIENKRRNK